MSLTELMQTIEPTMTATGYGLAVGASAYVVGSAAWSLRRGTTFLQQLKTPYTILVGALVGGITAFIAYAGLSPDNISALDQVVQFVGAAGIGAGLGSIVRPIGHAMRTHDGLFDDIKNQAYNGAVRGAVIAPITYAGMKLLT
ncbi:MAG: hypothetical protein V1725_06490 [archaeon]